MLVYNKVPLSCTTNGGTSVKHLGSRAAPAESDGRCLTANLIQLEPASTAGDGAAAMSLLERACFACHWDRRPFASPVGQRARNRPSRCRIPGNGWQLARYPVRSISSGVSQRLN
ncbi:hypothetical protein FJTKL_08390 [Diaporthe vaccinii]|uniref:Uncharacterized protein n=1 Tax=Diaporthe vaccinii TaxID=105482 RepID=A0ABR4ERU8_9PEZI